MSVATLRAGCYIRCLHDQSRYLVRQVEWVAAADDPTGRRRRPSRLLVEDHDGSVFVMAAHRLRHGPWRVDGQVRRLGNSRAHVRRDKRMAA